MSCSRPRSGAGPSGDWSPEVSWTPERSELVLVDDDVTTVAHAARVRWGYTRTQDGGGSVTVLFPRSAR